MENSGSACHRRFAAAALELEVAGSDGVRQKKERTSMWSFWVFCLRLVVWNGD